VSSEVITTSNTVTLPFKCW